MVKLKPANNKNKVLWHFINLKVQVDEEKLLMAPRPEWCEYSSGSGQTEVTGCLLDLKQENTEVSNRYTHWKAE